MKKVRLKLKVNEAQLELSLNQTSQVEVFLHKLKSNKTIRIASILLNKGKKRVSLKLNQLEKGIYIYTVNRNEVPMGFGRL
ncbi:MAG: hypothetical protein ACPGJS_23850, partial [Flammeovirgaceae bacterium]